MLLVSSSSSSDAAAADKEMYARSISDPAGFWADIASQFHWEKKVRQRGTLCNQAGSTRAEKGGGKRHHHMHTHTHTHTLSLSHTHIHTLTRVLSQWDADHMSYNFDPRKGPVFTKFFSGATTNICYNALDRHVEAGLGGQACLLFEGNDPDREKEMSYSEVLAEVCRLVSGVHAVDWVD
jgi:acetyl-CoA synthetase